VSGYRRVGIVTPRFWQFQEPRTRVISMKLEQAGLVDRLEFCEQVRICPRTARYWAVKGYGPAPRRIGGRVFYAQPEIDAFLLEIRDRPSVVA